MTTANKITTLRFAFIPAIIVFMLLFQSGAGVGWAAAAWAVFALAAATDKLDGYIAKKYNQITDFGKIMDPLADKLLVFAAMALFTAFGVMHPVALWIIIARELAITSMRAVFAGKGKIIAADFSGKLKTVVQLTGILIILALPVLAAFGLTAAEEYSSAVCAILTWLMAAVTLWSGIDYIVKNRDVFSGSSK